MLPQSHSSCSARTSPFFPHVNEGGMVPRKYNVKLTYSLLKMSKLKSFYTWESGTFWKSFTKFAALKESQYSNSNNEQAWRGWNQRLKSTPPPIPHPAPIKNICKKESSPESGVQTRFLMKFMKISLNLSRLYISFPIQWPLTTSKACSISDIRSLSAVDTWCGPKLSIISLRLTVLQFTLITNRAQTSPDPSTPEHSVSVERQYKLALP